MKIAWRSPGARASLIILLTCAAYLPALRCGFIWDDDYYVTENPLLTATDGLRRIWFSTHSQSQYFPLVFTTLRFERMLWGLNPTGYHVVNVLVHSLNALLVWIVLERLALPGAWMAGAIWAVHPVNVESVAWITELKNTQSTLFYLLALLAWMKFADNETPRPRRFYALALALYALALLSKTTACMLPAALALVLWVRHQPIRWRNILPFLILGVAMGLVSVWWEGHLGHYGGTYFNFNMLERCLIASRAVWFYAMKLAWPVHLTFSYPRWPIDPRGPAQYVWLVGCAAVALLLWRQRNREGRRGCVGGIVFFVATLSPLLGFVPLATFRWSFVADHYQYVASIGLIALFTAMVTRQAAAWSVSCRARRAVLFLLLLVLGALTWRQCYAYRNLQALWEDTLAKNPGSWMAHNNLGIVLQGLGRLSEAQEHYEQALRIDPEAGEAHQNLGNSLVRAGKIEDAIRHYELALRVTNSDPSKTYHALGNALLRLGKVQEAIEQYQRALQIRPDFAEALYNLGNTLSQAGRVSEALEQYELAVAAKPDYAEAHYNSGVLLLQFGRMPDAMGQFEEAVRFKPDYAEAHNNLGLALFQLGRIGEAKQHYEEALRAAPDFAEAHYNLGNVLLQMGDMAEAIQHYQKAVQRKPDYAEAHNNWGVALFQVGRLSEAKDQFEETLRLNPEYGEARSNLAALLALPGTGTPQK